MVWNHVDDCYFCMTNVAGFSSKSKGNIKYPNLTLAIRPVPHSADLPPPLFTSLPEVGDEPVSSTSEESSLEDEHKWMICGDLKVLSMLLGQQGGYIKYPCFLCLWDSRVKDEHWIREQWPKRNKFTVGEKNILNESLVPPDKVILPPLHIKLGLMKQYVKSLDKGGECFKYICQKFSFLSHEKIKASVFDGPKIRQLMKNKELIETMSQEEKNGWIAFSQVVNNFLGNTKSPEYKEIVKTLLDNFHKLGCNMSVKVHYLQSFRVFTRKFGSSE